MVMTSTPFTKLHLAIGWSPVRPPFSSSGAQVIWRGIYPSLLISHWSLALTLANCYPPTHPLEKEFRFFKRTSWRRNPLLIKRVGIVRDSDSPSGRLAILFCWLSTLLAKKRWKKVQGVSNSHRMCTHAGRQPQYATIITFESTRLFFCNKVGAASLSYFPQAMIELVLPGVLTIASDFKFEISAAVFNQIPSTVASGIPVI